MHTAAPQTVYEAYAPVLLSLILKGSVILYSDTKNMIKNKHTVFTNTIL